MFDLKTQIKGTQPRPNEVARSMIEAAIRSILMAVGEDPTREGLLETPSRAAKMYLEVFSGLFEEAEQHLDTQFTVDTRDGMVVVRDIHFYSMCEHHLLPFFGKVHIAYVPKNNRVAGLSKFARVVETLAKRPQMQERLTTMIADVITAKLAPHGVLVVIEAEHMCMAMRGIRSGRAATTTLVATGSFQENSVQKDEALTLIRLGSRSANHHDI